MLTRLDMLARLKRFLITLVLHLLLIPPALVAVGKVLNPPLWGWQIHRSLFPPAGYPARAVHQWQPLSAISPHAQLAVIASEDQLFTQHHGIDINAILTILKNSGTDGPHRGGSTITQQTAKNLFLFPSRTFWRKGVELYFTLWMEWLWDKSRILEVYLNIAEFGPGIYGIEAASQTYFGQSAANLSAQQAAQLASVLPNPYKIKPTPMSEYVARRSHWIRWQMRQLGSQSLDQL